MIHFKICFKSSSSIQFFSSKLEEIGRITYNRTYFAHHSI